MAEAEVIMYKNYYEIDEHVLADIHKYEDQQLSKFKSEFDYLCLSISKLYNWNYTVCIHRWIDTADKWRNKELDGYTATLQIDFTDNNGNLIEIDEYICSFFENITFISFNPIRQRYRVFQNEKLEGIRTEIRRFIRNIEVLLKRQTKTGDGSMSSYG